MYVDQAHQLAHDQKHINTAINLMIMTKSPNRANLVQEKTSVLEKLDILTPVTTKGGSKFTLLIKFESQPRNEHVEIV